MNEPQTEPDRNVIGMLTIQAEAEVIPAPTNPDEEQAS